MPGASAGTSSEMIYRLVADPSYVHIGFTHISHQLNVCYPFISLLWLQRSELHGGRLAVGHLRDVNGRHDELGLAAD